MPDPLQHALGLAGAIVTLQLLAALAAAVKLQAREPALYRAVLVGEAGRTLGYLKLRTMRARADAPGKAG